MALVYSFELFKYYNFRTFKSKQTNKIQKKKREQQFEAWIGSINAKVREPKGNVVIFSASFTLFPLFRNKIFVLEKMTLQNDPKLALFYIIIII